MRKQFTRRTGRSGTIMVELALVAPLLLLMVAGGADFARVYFNSVTLSNAAGAGAFYGSQSNVYSVHDTQMQQVAQNDANDLGAITTSSSHYCDCPNGTKVDCITGSCPNYGAPRVYVSTHAEKTFKPLLPFPGVPRSVKAGRTAYFRVQ